MPKVKRKFQTSSPPPFDYLWGLVLERQKTYGYNLQEMANIAGISYEQMRQYINKSPWEWKKDVRDRVCKYFGINIQISPNVDGRLEVNIS